MPLCTASLLHCLSTSSLSAQWLAECAALCGSLCTAAGLTGCGRWTVFVLVEEIWKTVFLRLVSVLLLNLCCCSLCEGRLRLQCCSLPLLLLLISAVHPKYSTQQQRALGLS